MSTPLHNEMAAALAELKEQQARITTALGELRAASSTVKSDDRTIEASVDSQGRLTELKFSGRRWRDLAPKELAAKLVDVISKAQNEAQRKSTALVDGLLPQGVDLDQLRATGPDLDALFQAALNDRTWQA